jgi:hypothetical protein
MDRLSGFRDILEIQRREMGSGRKTDRAASRSSAQLPAGLQRPEISSFRDPRRRFRFPKQDSIRGLLLSEIYYAVYRARFFYDPPEYRGWSGRSRRLDGILSQEQKVRDEIINKARESRVARCTKGGRLSALDASKFSPCDRCIGCRLPAH